jgi:hypothetical protein
MGRANEKIGGEKFCLFIIRYRKDVSIFMIPNKYHQINYEMYFHKILI